MTSLVWWKIPTVRSSSWSHLWVPHGVGCFPCAKILSTADVCVVKRRIVRRFVSAASPLGFTASRRRTSLKITNRKPRLSKSRIPNHISQNHQPHLSISRITNNISQNHESPTISHHKSPTTSFRITNHISQNHESPTTSLRITNHISQNHKSPTTSLRITNHISQNTHEYGKFNNNRP